ncbi:unnamed protein product [Mytilus coruscus]|uniref:RING-type E3 ubiquitin transferase n=1 Tax=Mytilus coruscus TaxID=42192 RepID=A0A6J8CY17_MYTCO|nr:unnamed protein product [Mytilus coruscus]
MAQKSTSKCDLCSVNEGSSFCYECKQALCISCRTIHDKIPLTKKHKVTDLNKVDRLVFQSDLGCSRHQELYAFFCNHCSCLICGTCLLDNHKGHRFCGIEEISKKARQDSEKLVSQGKTKVAEVTKVIQKINSKIATDSDATNAIELDSSVLHDIIDIVKDTWLHVVENNKQLEKEPLQTPLKMLEKLKVKYETATSTFEQLLGETHDTIFYSAYALHKSDYSQLDEIPKYIQPGGIKQFNIQAFLTDILFKIQWKYSCAGAVIDKIAKTNASAAPELMFKIPVQDEIVITVMRNGSHLVNIRLSDTISNVKEKVQEKTGIPPNQQSLQFGNKILRDNLTVFDYNIQNGSTLYIGLARCKNTETDQTSNN